MEQYIKKSALAAEIKRLIKHSEMVADHNTQITELVSRELDTLYHLISFLNTLEEKKVDLESEITLWANAIPEIRLDDVERLATYFFELGIKTQKGE